MSDQSPEEIAAPIAARWTKAEYSPEEVADIQDAIVEGIMADRKQRAIEILHQRDPDAGCTHTVYVNGEEKEDITIEDIDPGAGYERSDWDERIEFVPEGYSPAFQAARLEALQSASGSEYITEGDGWRYVDDR